jgi:hypothetical protein
MRELAICIGVITMLLALAVVLLSRMRDEARVRSDSTQLRGIHQGMVMAPQGGPDSYLLPSWIDRAGTTLAGDPASKDTTANIFSIHIYFGFFGPELCVSPSETNPNIRIMTDYQYSEPGSALTPSQALWDPAFSADFSSGKTSNFSYAHLLSSGKARRAKWTNSFSSTEPILANRGPRVYAVTYGGDTANPAIDFDRKSNTLGIHGPSSSWEGNVVYNDHHVAFETRLDPPQASRTDTRGKSVADCLFFDEPEDEEDMNAVLGIFTRAGAEPSDFHSIWD